MSTKDILLLLLPILTAIIGSYLTYFFTSRSKRNEAILRFKEEKYGNMLVLLQGFVGKTASPGPKRKFFEEQYRSWLYCSDDVVKAINQMVALVIKSEGSAPNPEKGREVIGNIVVAMRKDLLGHTSLKAADFQYTDVVT